MAWASPQQLCGTGAGDSGKPSAPVPNLLLQQSPGVGGSPGLQRSLTVMPERGLQRFLPWCPSILPVGEDQPGLTSSCWLLYSSQPGSPCPSAQAGRPGLPSASPCLNDATTETRHWALCGRQAPHLAGVSQGAYSTSLSRGSYSGTWPAAGQAAFPTPPAAKRQAVHKARASPEPWVAPLPALPVLPPAPSLPMAEPSTCPRCAREQPRATGGM